LEGIFWGGGGFQRKLLQAIWLENSAVSIYFVSFNIA